MSLSLNVQAIYNYLVEVVVPNKRVVTYGAVSQATNVPLGPPGQNPVVDALYEIFKKCDGRRLPPITSIVVQQDGQYDSTGRHGMPGGGFVAAGERGKGSTEGNRKFGSGFDPSSRRNEAIGTGS